MKREELEALVRNMSDALATELEAKFVLIVAAGSKVSDASTTTGAISICVVEKMSGEEIADLRKSLEGVARDLSMAMAEEG